MYDDLVGLARPSSRIYRSQTGYQQGKATEGLHAASNHLQKARHCSRWLYERTGLPHGACPSMW